MFESKKLLFRVFALRFVEISRSSCSIFDQNHSSSEFAVLADDKRSKTFECIEERALLMTVPGTNVTHY